MDVTVLRPLCENLREYRPGDQLWVPPERALRLADLGFVAFERPSTPTRVTSPEAEKTQREAWRKLRTLIGANRPIIPVFPTRRSRLDTLQPGEKFLILMRYAGIGDHIVASMLFPALQEQYPQVQASYAIPRRFHPLFERTSVRVIAHDDAVQASWLKEYDLIEDINTPCHVWENFFVAYGGTTGDGHGLRWLHRLDMMSHWFGLKVKKPRSEITIGEDEKRAARELIASTRPAGRPVCIFSPLSFSQARSYPWFAQVAERLIADGWAVRYLHSARLPGSVPTLAGLPIRMMGAVCSVADLIVSVDTATFHWGGIFGRPTVAIFNSQLGVNHCRDYPTAHPVQTCDTPCIHNVRWGGDNGSCPHLTRESLPAVPGIGVSRCFARSTVDQIMAEVRAYVGRPGKGNGI